MTEYTYVPHPDGGYQQRKNWKPEGGAGRPPWEPIESGEARRLVTTYHDARGGLIALDQKLEELQCGAIRVRRCRKRVRLKKGEMGAVPASSDGQEEAEEEDGATA